jgi:hypothetical protein
MRYFKKIEFSKLFTDKPDEKELVKLTEAITIHGYRGASKKRHNGVVPIRPSDKQLLKDLKNKTKNEPQKIQTLYQNCCKVKVVAHVPSGNRLVGYMYNINEKVGNSELGLYIVTSSHY